MDARFVGQCCERAVAAPAPHVLHGCVVDRVGEEVHLVVLCSQHGTHLQIVGRHLVPLDHQSTRAVAVGGHHHLAVIERRRRPRNQLDPGRVPIGEERAGAATAGIGLQHHQRPLIT